MDEELLELFKGARAAMSVKKDHKRAIDLLNEGANPNQTLRIEGTQLSLIEIAIMNECSEVAVVLIQKKADIFMRSKGIGFSLLDEAIGRNLDEVSKELIAHGIATVPQYAAHSLYLTIFFNRTVVAKKLIEESKVKIPSDHIGLAVYWNREEIFNILLSKLEAEGKPQNSSEFFVLKTALCENRENMIKRLTHFLGIYTPLPDPNGEENFYLTNNPLKFFKPSISNSTKKGDSSIGDRVEEVPKVFFRSQ